MEGEGGAVVSNAGAVNARCVILKKESCHIRDWNGYHKVSKVATLIILSDLVTLSYGDFRKVA